MLYFKYIVLTTNQVPKSKKVLNHSQQKVHVNCYKISVHSSQDKQCICDYVHYMIFIRLFFFFLMALAAQSRSMASSFLRFFRDRTQHTPQSVGLLWTSDQPVA